MLRKQCVLVIAAANLLLAGISGRAARQSSGAIASGGGLRTARMSAEDLEIGGDLAGLPPGTTRYLTRDDLLTLPQVRYTVSDDTNFAGPQKISGVELEELARRFGAAPGSEVVIAVCDDKYRAHYSRAYRATHRPLLVLEVNGQPPAGWPKSSEGAGMGPYMVSHPKFAPSFQVLSNPEEAQIPWGVVRLEFRDEQSVFGAIAPRGSQADDAQVQAGLRLAQQNCFRCHNMGSEGGLKAGLPWTAVAAIAARSPAFFAAYVRNPQATNPKARMEGSPGYDDATMAALEAYFRTFAAGTQSQP